MKNTQLLLLALIGYGAFYLIYKKSKKKGKVIVDDPTKITEEQYNKYTFGFVDMG